jgi:hypothetical protein
MVNKKKKPELKIVFDTNVIFSGTASYLVNKNTADFITENSDFTDLKTSWHLPDIVIKERIFQMTNKGNELLLSVNKLEKLLGHNLNITEDIIIDRVGSAIENQLTKHSLNRIDLNIDNINWDRIITNSVNRIAPFENSQKEKGFRDALILEALEQLVINSPKTPKICRIAFICDDTLLNEAAKERLKDYTNIRFLSNLTSLKGLINVLVSEIEESIINQISQTASDMFFIPQDEKTIYYKENIRERIKELYSVELHAFPDKFSTKIELGTWYITPVNFIKKVKQRIWLSSQIEVDMTSYKTENRPIKKPSFMRIGQSSSIANVSIGNKYGLMQSTYPDEMIDMPVSIENMKGKSIYDVIWSVTYGTNKKIINPKIERIDFIENEWGKE